MNLKRMLPLLALAGLAGGNSFNAVEAPAERVISGPPKKQTPRFVKRDLPLRKNPCPNGRGSYRFTGPVAMNPHTRRRHEALRAAFGQP